MDVPAQGHAEDLGGCQAETVGSELAEMFLYPGDGHLFTDSSLPSYDPAATALVLQRSREFLDRVS